MVCIWRSCGGSHKRINTLWTMGSKCWNKIFNRVSLIAYSDIFFVELEDEVSFAIFWKYWKLFHNVWVMYDFSFLIFFLTVSNLLQLKFLINIHLYSTIFVEIMYVAKYICFSHLHINMYLSGVERVHLPIRKKVQMPP